MKLALLLIAGLALTAPQAGTPSPNGVISGRILDDEGRPIRGAQVMALAFIDQNGRLRTTPRGRTAETNDRGEYRLFWLDPGAYFVAVDANPVPFPPAPVAQSRLAYIPSSPDSIFAGSYYPGTADVRQAELVQVGSGEVALRSMQPAALPARVVQIRISPMEENTGIYLPGIAIYAEDGLNAAPVYQGTPRRLSDGTWEVRAGLGSGEYRVDAGLRTISGTRFGSATVRIGDTDASVVNIPLSDAVSIRGQVSDTANLTPLRIISIPTKSNAFGKTAIADARANGSFNLELVPGEYSIHVEGLGNDAYVSEAAVGDSKVSPGAVVIADKDTSLHLTIAHDGSMVTGIAVDEARMRKAGATVVLVPEASQRAKTGLFRVAVTNARGEFFIRGAVPGKYRLAVLNDLTFQELASTLLESIDKAAPEFVLGARVRWNAGTIQVLTR